MNKMKILLVLLILVGILFADKCWFGTERKGEVCVPNYLINLANIFLFSFLGISGIIFMLGNALASPRITEYGKALLKITLENAFILLIFYSLLAWLDTTASVIANTKFFPYPRQVSRTPPSDLFLPFRVGTYYLSLFIDSLPQPYKATLQVIFGLLRPAEIYSVSWRGIQQYVENYLVDLKSRLAYSFFGVSIISLLAGAINTLNVALDLETLGIEIQTVYIPIGSLFSSLVFALTYATTAISIAFLNIELQYQIFSVIGRSIFPFLLPLGIFLRTFPITRGAGSALIAISIGFGILLPIGYIIIRDISEEVCGAPNFDIFSLVSALSTFNPYYVKDALLQQFRSGGILWWMFCVVSIEGIILPFFMYIMVLNLIRHLAEIMGTHIDLSTLVRII